VLHTKFYFYFMYATQITFAATNENDRCVFHCWTRTQSGRYFGPTTMHLCLSGGGVTRRCSSGNKRQIYDAIGQRRAQDAGGDFNMTWRRIASCRVVITRDLCIGYNYHSTARGYDDRFTSVRRGDRHV